MEIATLAGGCFWCLESAFNQLKGVEQAVSGYMGGHLDAPTYEQICTGRTGHAEVVQVHFDQNLIGYDALLEVFFALHDPTTLNRQGNDVGTQYRSAIFCHTPEQETQARATIRRLTETGAFSAPIVTEVTQAAQFWPAEDYHQGYAEQNPNQPYCLFVVGPKLAKFRNLFALRLKPEPG
ncbi:MAG: peptide-methionine (S)-S-oxide reductase MsrA [Pseudomonadota bacterium]